MPTPRERLHDARLYLCAPAGTDRAVLDAALAGGVDLLQLRDHDLDRGDDDALLRAAEPFQAAAAAAGALFVLNDRPDLAARLGADGVHVGQDDVSVAEARAAVGADAIVGLSTHDPDQGAAADADDDVDHLSVGPVHPTPTKPGRPAAGIGYVEWAAANVAKPWFAIGGLDERTTPAVVTAGATRIVVVRAILDAPDPGAAAAQLRSLLPVAVGAPRKRRRPRAAEPPRSGLAADVRPPGPTTQPAVADAADDPATQAGAAPPRRPDVQDRHGPDAGVSRSEARNAAIREQLEPLAPGERPTSLKVAVAVAVVVAIANLALAGSGAEVPGQGSALAAVTPVAILLVAAAGMWARRYWAVLLFEVVLGITCVYAGLSLLVASNAVAALLSVAIVAFTGVLFYKLVRVMARLQVPAS